MRKPVPMKYKLGNRRKRLLNDAFLQTMKDELDRIFDTAQYGKPTTYMSDYVWMEGTYGFHEALKIASERHQLIHAIYEYACRLTWWEIDHFDGILTDLMMERGIIEEGTLDSQPGEEYLRDLEAKGEIQWVETVVQHKGYRVTTRDWQFI